MSVNLIFKIAAVGILVTVLSQVLKHSGREEHAFLTSLAGLIIVLFWIVPYIYCLRRCSRFLRYRSYSSYNLAGSEKDMDIIKVGILGVAAVLMAIPLRKEKQEYSMFLSMAVCICIFIYIITKVQIVLEFVEKLEGMIAIDSTYIGLVIKMVGITYAAEFAVNVCRDSGYGAIAGQIENFAKMSILVVSLPVLMAFIDTVGSLL